MPKGAGGEDIFTPEGPPKKRRSRSRPRKPTFSSIEDRNKVFADFRAGVISQSEAIGKISGASARASFESRLTAEVERKQIERQKERQEKIEAGTITGQVTRDPGTVDIVRDGQFDPSRSFRRGAGEATGAFFSDIGKDISIVATGLFTGRGFGGLVDPFKSFEQVGAQEGEQISITPQFGTTQTDLVTGKRVTGEQSLFELQAEAQREAGIPEEVIGRSPGAQAAFIGTQAAGRVRKEFQEKVDLGQLGVEEAETQAQKSFEQQFGERTSQLVSLGGDFTKRSGETFAAVGREAAIFGGLTIASFGLSPTAFAAASVLGGTIGVATGSERTRDILFGAGLIGGLQAPGAIARSINIGRLAALESQQLRTLGVQATEGRETLTILTGLRRTDAAKQTIGLITPTFETGVTRGGATRFTVGGGRGVSVTELQSFALEGLVPKGKDIITTTELLSFSARGRGGLPSALNIGDIGFDVGRSGSFGRLDLFKGADDKFSRSVFGGVSKTQDDIISIIGGRGAKIKINLDQAGLIQRQTLRSTPESFGKILKVNLKDLDSTGQVFGTAGRGGRGITGFEQTTTQALSSGLKGQEFGAQAGLKVTDLVKSTTRSGGLDLKQVPSIVGGAGVSQFSGTGQDIISPSITGDQFSFQLPKVDTFQTGFTGLVLDVGTKPTQRGGQRGAFIPRLDVKPIQETGQTPKSALEFSPKQIQETIQIPISSFGFRGDFGFGFEGGFGGVPLPPIPLPGLPTFGRGLRKGRRVPKRKPGRIAPSLTGITQFQLGGITGGPLPTVGELGLAGITPGSLRLVPGTNAKKKSKRKSKKKN